MTGRPRRTRSSDTGQTISDRRQKSPSGDRLLLIRASAGTGKTYQLSNRYLRLLRHCPPDRILASTFTRKAAGEILERILVRLARAATDDKELCLLAEALGEPPLTREDCLNMLRRLTRDLHRVNIGTLDAFFARLAGSFSLELGLPPRWRMLDEMEAATLRDQAIDRVLRQGPAQETAQLMHLLDKGNSSRSIAGLIERTVSDLYSVYLSAPAEAWQQFPDVRFLNPDERERLLEQLEVLPLAGSQATARDKDVAAFRARESESLLEKGLLRCALGNGTYNRKPLPPELIALYRRLAADVRAEILTPWQHQTIATQRLLEDFRTAYEQLKHAAGGLEFDDVTRCLARSQNDAEIDPGYRLDAPLEHLLLDEFQDTSPAQWNVLRRFARRICDSPEQTLFCVGDTKQAIYGWRGGEAAIFDTIGDELPGLCTQPLDASFRSSPVIMDAVNDVMLNLHRHDHLEEYTAVLHHWSDNFPRQTTTRNDLPGHMCLWTSSAAPTNEGKKPDKASQSLETRRYAARLVSRLAEESPHATIGVLTRTNDEVRHLIFELHQLGIEASEEGGNPLTDSAAVDLLLALLTLADHPGDTVARYHVAHSPLFEILECPRLMDDRAAHSLAAEIRARLVPGGFGGLLHDLARPLSACCTPRELRRLSQLTEMADEFDVMRTTLRPSEFVSYVHSQRRDEPSSARVRVMNVHQAKGLEFDIVVLPELDEALIRSPRYVTRSPAPGAPPDLVALYRNETTFQFAGGALAEARAQTLARQLNESLCLLYVAMTRAISSLQMVIAPTVSAHHAKTYAGLLRAALAPDLPLDPEKVLYERGDREWFRHVPPKATAAVSETPAVDLRFADAPRRRRLPRVAPSQLKSGLHPSSAITVGGGDGALRRGTLFHHWLQGVTWLSGSPPPLAELELAGAALEVQPGTLKDDARQFQEALRRPEIARLFVPPGDNIDSYPPFSSELREELRSSTSDVVVRTELPFAIQDDRGLLTGSIDRIVIFLQQGRPCAAEVIDFKTDAVDPSNPGPWIEAYRGQMEAYRRAASQLLDLDPGRVSVRLAFLASGQVAVV